MKSLPNELPEGAQEIIQYQGYIFYEHLGTIYKKVEAFQHMGYEIVSTLKNIHV